MIEAREAAGALYGIWRIVRCDEKAFTFFNATESGFWRSFTAAFLLVPLQALYQITVYITLEDPPHALRMAAIEGLEYTILWLLFPITMYYVVRLIGREDSFLRYIVAYNWFQLGIGFVVMPWIILTGFGFLPTSVADFASTMSFVAYTFYAAFIARAGLSVAVGTAIGIVLIDILLTLMLGQVTVRMH